jgi:hypothetical protein
MRSSGEFLIGYFLGLAVAIAVIIFNHQPVTGNDIKQAEAACIDNKGVKEIDSGEYRCINGAVFEKGEGK